MSRWLERPGVVPALAFVGGAAIAGIVILVIVVFLYGTSGSDASRHVLPRAKLFLTYRSDGQEREIPESADAFLDRTCSVTDIQVAALAGTVSAVLATLVRYEIPA